MTKMLDSEEFGPTVSWEDILERKKNNSNENQASYYSTSAWRVADFCGHTFAYLFLK